MEQGGQGKGSDGEKGYECGVNLSYSSCAMLESIYRIKDQGCVFGLLDTYDTQAFRLPSQDFVEVHDCQYLHQHAGGI